jgi:hypothetical protein
MKMYINIKIDSFFVLNYSKFCLEKLLFILIYIYISFL